MAEEYGEAEQLFAEKSKWTEAPKNYTKHTRKT